MKVLVIGATGFIGKAIVNELSNNLIDVVAVGGPHSKLGIKTFECVDIADPDDIAKLEQIQDIDVVIHAAGLAHKFGKITEDDIWKVNVLGTKNIAGLAAKLKVRHFILISSVLVYGQHHPENLMSSYINEESPCDPKDIYARSKFSAEKTAIEICHEKGIPLTILRPAPVIGAGSKGNFARLIKLVASGRFVWLGKGKNRKSLVSVDDVAKACFAVLKKNKPETEIFNISGPAFKMNEIISLIYKHIARKPYFFSIPVGPVTLILKIVAAVLPITRIRNLQNIVEKWVSDDIYSAEKIRKEYGFIAAADIPDVIRHEVELQTKQK